MRAQRAGRVAYTYDTRGRVVARTLPTLSGQRRATTYTWTSDDRLAAVTTPDGGTWTYTYDPLGRRTTKTAPDATPTRFTWDGPVLVAEHHDTLARVWHHHPGTYRPITQTTRTRAVDGRPSPVVTRAVLTDTAGTPTHLADPSTGTLTWTRDATVWGIRRAPRQTDPPTAESVVDLLDYCPLDHPGQYHDPETATNDNHHRHYDPHTAAYLTADPLGLTPAPNHRTYPHNPHTWTDPHGLEKESTDETCTSLFRASPRGWSASDYDNGYNPANFPGEGWSFPDGRAYFGLDDISIAEEYASRAAYDDDIIEVLLPTKDFEQIFRDHALPYDGGPRMQVAIPRDLLPTLNTYPRRWASAPDK